METIANLKGKDFILIYLRYNRIMRKTKRFLRRYFPIVVLVLINIVWFSVMLATKTYDQLSLSSLNPELTSLMGIMLGLTFTTFSILIGIVPVIEKRIKDNQAFKSIGKIILTATSSEVIALACGLASTAIGTLSYSDKTTIELINLFFSVLSLSLITLMSYYLYLTFSYVSTESN